MKTYTLKPLKWKKVRTTRLEYAAHTIFGSVVVRQSQRLGGWVLGSPEEWWFSPSRSAAQLRAEEWYEERIMTALEPVETQTRKGAKR